MEEVKSILVKSDGQEDASEDVYYKVYERHYRDLVEGLPMDSLFPTLSSAGLLGDTQLRQNIISAQADTSKARFLLESMRGGLKIGNNGVFIKFVKAIMKYAYDNHNQIVKKLADNVCEDLPRPLRDLSEQQNTTEILPKFEPATEETFAECKTLGAAFILLTVKMKHAMLHGDFEDIRRSCIDHFNSPDSGVKIAKKIEQKINECSNLNELFDLLSNKQKRYWNGFDIRILQDMAIASQRKEARATVALYENVIHPRKLCEISPNLLPYEDDDKENYPLYTVVKEMLKKDADTVTVGDIVKHRIRLERKFGIKKSLALLGISHGSMIIYWAIPTEMAYYVYQSVKKNYFLFDTTSSLEIGDYPAIEFPIEFPSETILTKEELTSWLHKESSKTLSSDAGNKFHEILSHCLDVELVGQLLTSNGLITEDELDGFNGAPCKYLKNSSLLEQIDLTDASVVHTLSTSLQQSDIENNKVIGEALLKFAKDDLQSNKSNVDSESDDDINSDDDSATSDKKDEESSSVTSLVSVGSKRKQSEDLESNHASVKRVKVSESYAIQFSRLLPKLYKLLENVSANVLTLILLQVRVDQSNMIPLFSSKDLKEYDVSASAATVLKTLRHCWSWYDFSLLKMLVKTSRVLEAVNLLDEFGSRIDFSQPLSTYPVSTISSSFVFDAESSFTVLATKVEKDYDEFTFQEAHEIKSMIVEKFEVTEHSIRLMAVNSNPTVFYWMIPKSIVSIINAKLQEKCGGLYTNGISEVAIFPNTIVATDGALKIGSLTYFSTSLIRKDMELIHLSQLKELPQYLTSLQSDLVESKKEAENLQLKLEEKMIIDMAEHQEETDNKDANYKVIAETQKEELSEIESELKVKKLDYQTLKSQNGMLRKHYLKLKEGNSTFKAKYENLDKENAKLQGDLLKLQNELSELKSQEKHKIATDLEVEVKEKEILISSMTEENDDLKSKLSESQEKVEMMIKHIEETDQPTLAQLCFFVLPLRSVAFRWDKISKALLGSNYVYVAGSFQHQCTWTFQRWIELGLATWSGLFGILHDIGLHKAVGQIYRRLQDCNYISLRSKKLTALTALSSVFSVVTGLIAEALLILFFICNAVYWAEYEDHFTFLRYTDLNPDVILVDFDTFDDLTQAFHSFSAKITTLLKLSDFDNLRNACTMQNSAPSGTRLPAEFLERMQRTNHTGDLINLIVNNGLLTWINISLIDAMAAASDIPEALTLVRRYKRFAFSKSLHEILPCDPTPTVKSEYLIKLSTKINKRPYQLTVNDLLIHKRTLEGVVLDIKEGSLDLSHISEGCIEVYYYIPLQLVSHAYECSLKNRRKFNNLHIRYLQFEDHDKVYSMEPAKPDTYLPHCGKQGASFLEVVSHYYQYLVEYMDSDSISHVMVCRKLLTGGDMEVINKCSSNRQRNVLLLNRVLHMSATELLAFCEVVQELEHQHYISTILTSALEYSSIPRLEHHESLYKPILDKFCIQKNCIVKLDGKTLPLDKVMRDARKKGENDLQISLTNCFKIANTLEVAMAMQTLCVEHSLFVPKDEGFTMPLTDVVRKKMIPSYVNNLVFEICEDGEDVEVPYIKYKFH